jgi:hypothetical protein
VSRAWQCGFSRERKTKVFRPQKLYVLTALICGFPQRVLRVVFRSLPLEPVADCSIPNATTHVPGESSLTSGRRAYLVQMRRCGNLIRDSGGMSPIPIIWPRHEEISPDKSASIYQRICHGSGRALANCKVYMIRLSHFRNSLEDHRLQRTAEPRSR